MADHWGFVAAAYAVATITVLAMIVVTLADYRAQRAALHRVEDADGRGDEQ